MKSIAAPATAFLPPRAGAAGKGFYVHNLSIEQQIQAKGLSAPRVTPQDVDDEVASIHFFTAEDGFNKHHENLFLQTDDVDADVPLPPAPLSLLTICVLVLRNGFTVSGESACASPANFDPEIGKNIAFDKAREKIWPLLGFRLRDKLAANDIEERARRAHEVNRAYCAALGDTSQLPWAEAPQWQRDSAIAGVRAALSGSSPEQLHESWLAVKRAEGWIHGEVKDPAAKTHPCMVPYDQLPPEQRMKDHLFRAAVLS